MDFDLKILAFLTTIEAFLWSFIKVSHAFR